MCVFLFIFINNEMPVNSVDYARKFFIVYKDTAAQFFNYICSLWQAAYRRKYEQVEFFYSDNT